MAMCRFTPTTEGAPPVFINPLLVFAVRWSEQEECTFIYAPAVEADGTKMAVKVREKAEDVVARLDLHMPRMA